MMDSEKVQNGVLLVTFGISPLASLPEDHASYPEPTCLSAGELEGADQACPARGWRENPMNAGPTGIVGPEVQDGDEEPDGGTDQSTSEDVGGVVLACGHA